MGSCSKKTIDVIRQGHGHVSLDIDIMIVCAGKTSFLTCPLPLSHKSYMLIEESMTKIHGYS